MIKDFIQMLCSADIPFLRYALLVGLIGSIPLGITGSFVVSRNITGIAGAMSHAVLGGVGFALYANRVWNIVWLTPFTGALLGALLSAILIYMASLYAKEKEDTVISGVWALGMSLGVLFIAATPGYTDLQGYLFGNILLATQKEIIITAVLSVIILLLTIIFFRPLQMLLFDSEFARLRNINVDFLYLLLLILIALTVVLMVNVAGVILLIALLSLPAATAKCYVRHLSTMMFAGAVIAMAEIIIGLFAGYTWDLPVGPASVIAAVAFYVIALLKNRFFSSGRK